MKISLTDQKKETLKICCKKLLNNHKQTIRYIARVIGIITSSLPGVKYGAFHYKYLERDKVNALKESKGSFDAKMVLSEKALRDINWWYENIMSSDNEINKEAPSMIVYSDASSNGWGAAHENNKTGGSFSLEENKYHINAKELLAAKFALNTFVNRKNLHVKLMSDNTTTVFGLNNMGCNKPEECNQIIYDIWSWAEKCNIWITSAYFPRKESLEADRESRKKQKDLEWMLDKTIFQKILHHFSFEPSVDLFASKLNNQLPHYVSYYLDPGALHINAFTIPWENFYAFPPFAILGRVLQKVLNDKSTGMVIVPNWPTQPGIV